jgi:hypothetical protein
MDEEERVEALVEIVRQLSANIPEERLIEALGRLTRS